MAARICDNEQLLTSLVDVSFQNLELDSKKIVMWKCEKCDGKWKESIAKRSNYKFCPMCQPGSKNNWRSAKVTLSTATKKAPILQKNKGLSEAKMCDICCEDRKKFIKCGLCDFECCPECLETYVLGGNEIFRCMNVNCGNVFSPKVLAENYTKKWLSDKKSGYAAHLLKIDVESEKSKIPSTLPLVPKYDEMLLVRKEQLKIDRKLHKIPEKRGEEFYYLRVKLEDLHEIERRIKDELFEGKITETPKIEKFIQGCPTEGCRGLINDKFICLVCNARICEKCRLLESPSHKCDPNDVESVKAMAENTKPCPKCATGIFKIDGCDQMFCMTCQTAFSWETGKIETGNIHNPHYFQWLRDSGKEVPRAPGDNPALRCGEVPHQYQFRPLLGLAMMGFSGNKEEYVFWTTTFGSLLNFAGDYQVSNRMNSARLCERSMKEFRLKYLKNTITEEKWAAQIFFSKQYQRLNLMLGEIYDSLRIILAEKCIELYQKLQEYWAGKTYTFEKIPWEIMNEFKRDVEQIRSYFNQCLIDENLGKSNSDIPIIGPKWDEMSYDEIIRGYDRPEHYSRRSIEV